MKKRSKKGVVVVIMLLTLTVGLLTGCGKDLYIGVAEITVNDEVADVTTGFSKLYYATENAYMLKDAEKATVHFWCPECQYDETVELVAPEAKMFSCKCEKDTAYFAIVVGNTELPTADEAK